MYDTLETYKFFFDLFDDFTGYINLFFLDDLLDENDKIKFYLPFDDFKTRPTLSTIDEYLQYKEGVIKFIKSRNKRIENYTQLQTK